MPANRNPAVLLATQHHLTISPRITPSRKSAVVKSSVGCCISTTMPGTAVQGCMYGTGAVQQVRSGVPWETTGLMGWMMMMISDCWSHQWTYAAAMCKCSWRDIVQYARKGHARYTRWRRLSDQATQLMREGGDLFDSRSTTGGMFMHKCRTATCF